PQPRRHRPPRRAGRGGRHLRRPRRVHPVDGTGGPGRRGPPRLHHPRRPRGRRAGHDPRPPPPRRRRPHHVGAPGHRPRGAPGVKYVSTRGPAPFLDFSDVLLAGLAADGGLYVPETWPPLPAADRTLGRPYAELATEVVWPYVEGSGVLRGGLEGV